MFNSNLILATFLPSNLFNGGEQGVWFDPSDFSTMFQDSAGATPVTAVGDPVGRILDKSGRGNHATQTTSTARPILRQDSGGRYYLEFDGTDDWLVTSSFTPGADKSQVFVGLRKLTDAFIKMVLETSATSNTNAGTITILGPQTATTSQYSFRSRGSVAPAALTVTGYAAPITNVIAALGDISGDSTIIRVNGSQVGSSSADQGTGNYLTYPMYIGSRNGAQFFLSGRIYGLIARFSSTNLDATTIAAAETWINSKTGAY